MASPKPPSRAATPAPVGVARAPSPNRAPASAAPAVPQRVRSPPPLHQPTTAADAVRAVIIAINGGAVGSVVSSAGASDAASRGSSGSGNGSGSKSKGKAAASTSTAAAASASSGSKGDRSPAGSDGSDERQPLVAAARDVDGGASADGDADGWLDDPVPDDKYEIYWYWSLASFVSWLCTRLFTLLLLLWGDGHHYLNRTASAFFGLEVVLTLYYWHRRRYFPGSAYTDVHFLLYSRVLRPAFVHNRFSPGFRFVFGCWGYFVCTGVLLNVDQYSDSPNWLLRIGAYAVLVISIKQLVLYAPVIVVWYVSLVISMYYYVFCFWLCIGAEHVPIFQDITEEHWSFPLYKFVFENA